MAFTLCLFPPKTTTINPFPQNPKTLILQQCKTLRDLNQIHAHLIKTRLFINPSISQNLLESAAILLPNAMDYAISIFHKVDPPTSQIFNIMIRGFTLNQIPLILFEKMLDDSVVPDQFTFPCILKACSRLQALKEGEQIHAHIIKSGYGSYGLVENTLIHMYASCGEIGVARRVFDGMSERGVRTWNSMFAGYTRMGCWEEVVKLFRKMVESGVAFDEVTLVSVLLACGRLADIELGDWINEFIEANGLSGNATLITSLLDMYAKCGRMDTARTLFNQMPERDVVSWSAMISGYSQAGRCREALDLFHDMQKENVKPNEITMVSVLSACAVLGALETGKWVHGFVKKEKMKLSVTLGTALVDFYAKCGFVDASVEVFDEMPVKNAMSWTVLIQGLASNGQGKRALEFFHKMLKTNVDPNDVTFLGVLSACSHAGFVKEGRGFFICMTRNFRIKPRIEHYGCMVDMLGRAGFIEEAHGFIKDMPIHPNAVVWRTLLGSCRVHKNVEIGEESLEHLIKLDPSHSGDYILLSNIYASVGRWEDALRVRNQMKERGIKKAPGCSSIELDGIVHEFFAEDNVHPHSGEVYNAVENMMGQIKLAGYMPDTVEVSLDAEEKDREASLSHHSEKLAIAFGLIRSSAGTTIRITKNLRVCSDCHNAMKFISKVYDREIVARDRNRFHHFKEGFCSCNDFW